jgi:FkbH-like protein
MDSVFADLAWLPAPPPDFGPRVKALPTSPDPIGRDIIALAQHALDVNLLTRLAKAIARARGAGKSLAPLAPFRLAILSNSTVDLIVPALVASAARHGIALEVVQPSYNQAMQEALTPDSTVNSSQPDAVLFALDYRALPISAAPGDRAGSDAAVHGALGYLEALRHGIQSHSKAVCIFQTFAPPVEALFGSLDRAVAGTLRYVIEGINRQLAETAFASGDVILDAAALAETVGLANWHNPQQWHLGKLPFSDRFIPLYADHVGRLVAALRGKSRRVLILDLDNTVWGGVIGDDGLEGIKVAQGDAIGEAHLAVQTMALNLRKRGIVLAVASKNHDDVARAPFLNHPEMLLKLDHIAVFQANWTDKATNIRAIAQELNLGLDAMVFLDDNPVERGLVRQLLPEVAVPELPSDPSGYARTLAAAGYFEAIAFTADDLQRADFYQENAKRVALHNQVDGAEAYLASLDMTITFRPFDSLGRARIVQLINKSNQYNLTTRRYTEPEVAAMEADPRVFTLQVRLADIFGDNGMISVAVCCPAAEPDVWEINTWLMSCRVLGRKVEHMVLREMLQHAAAAGVRKLVGVYIPSGRNTLVEDHYAKLGFTQESVDGSGTTRWMLPVDGAFPEDAPMKVISEGFRSR